MNDTECSSRLASSLQNGVRVAMKALTIAVPVVASFAAQLTALKDMDAERMVKMLGGWRYMNKFTCFFLYIYYTYLRAEQYTYIYIYRHRYRYRDIHRYMIT